MIWTHAIRTVAAGAALVLFVQRVCAAPSVLDLGVRPADEPVLCTVPVANETDRPITVRKVRTSCPCVHIAAYPAELGPGGLRETASVAANFQRMVRIADATGIPQDAPVLMLGDDLIEELDLRRFGSAGNTPGINALQRCFGRLLRPAISLVVRRASASRAKRKAA